jgi:hypothetical protein
MSRPCIRRLVEGVHMGLGHDGLALLLKKLAKIDASKMEDGDLVMFINTAGDKMKIIGGQGRVIGYLKMPGGRKIMKEALQFIPQTFGASGFSYDDACAEALNRRLMLVEKQKLSGTSPLAVARAKQQAGV